MDIRLMLITPMLEVGNKKGDMPSRPCPVLKYALFVLVLFVKIQICVELGQQPCPTNLVGNFNKFQVPIFSVINRIGWSKKTDFTS